MNKEQRERFDSFLENAKEKLDDAKMFVGCRISNAKDAVANARANSKDGFSHVEIWNFGDYITLRMANLCAYLSEADYDEKPSYLNELVPKERIFRGLEVFNSTAMDSASGKLIDYSHMFDIEQTVAKEQLMPTWMWILDTLMNPDVYVAPNDTDTCIDKLVAKTTPEISFEDVKNLPVSEARRMSRILKKFAENCYGHADKYASSEHAYQTIEERGGSQWENGQSLAIGLLTHRGTNWRDAIWGRKDGYVYQKSRKELGIDWVAWIEDVLHAADILELYANWIYESPTKGSNNEYVSKKAHLDSVRDSMFLLDPKAAAEIEEKIMNETRSVWKWIGVNIPGFWD